MDENYSTIRFITNIFKDPELKEKFKKNPKETLKEQNVFWSDSRVLKVFEDTAEKKYIVIRQPSEVNDHLLSSLGLPESQINFIRQIAQSKVLNEKLKKNPKVVLRSFHIDIPQEHVEVLEDNNEVAHWVIPSDELSDDMLSGISAGTSVNEWVVRIPLFIQIP